VFQEFIAIDRVIFIIRVSMNSCANYATRILIYLIKEFQ